MREILTKIGDFVNIHQRDLVVAAAMGLIAWSFFNLGRITAPGPHALRIEQDSARMNDAGTGGPAAPLDARVVTSKNSDKYHYSWCSSGKRIKPENQVWFETAAAAKAAGYSLAGNCR